MTARRRAFLRSALLASACLACDGPAPVDLSGPIAPWPDYGGDKGGLKYSPLTQINAGNVAELELAWVHRSGDVSDGSGETTKTAFQVTPIAVNDTLYYCTGLNRVFARVW